MQAARGGTFKGILYAVCPAPVYGAYNGYVWLGESHPWHQVDRWRDIDADIPGGLTYLVGNWFGFDALHPDDWWPQMATVVDRRPEQTPWSLNRVEFYTIEMARAADRQGESGEVEFLSTKETSQTFTGRIEQTVTVIEVIGNTIFTDEGWNAPIPEHASRRVTPFIDYDAEICGEFLVGLKRAGDREWLFRRDDAEVAHLAAGELT